METGTPAGSIAVGVDGSAAANRAIVWAAEHAASGRRPLTIVHSTRRPRPGEVDWLTVLGADPDEVDRVMAAAAASVVDDAAALATSSRPGLEIRRLVSDRDPRQLLLEVSTSAELLVVGARGQTVLMKLALGSVSSSVVRHATCPVVVVGDHLAGSDHLGVLVGADGTPASRPVIEWAFGYAALHDLPLTVMHCFWDVAGKLAHGAIVHPEEHGYDDLRVMLSESVAGLSEKFPDVVVDLELARGLVDVALAGGTPPHDLVVIGRRQGSPWSRLLYSSATTAVLERAHGPVAVVPEPDGLDDTREVHP